MGDVFNFYLYLKAIKAFYHLNKKLIIMGIDALKEFNRCKCSVNSKRGV